MKFLKNLYKAFLIVIMAACGYIAIGLVALSIVLASTIIFIPLAVITTALAIYFMAIPFAIAQLYQPTKKDGPNVWTP